MYCDSNVDIWPMSETFSTIKALILELAMYIKRDGI